MAHRADSFCFFFLVPLDANAIIFELICKVILWKDQVVESLFQEREAKIILSTPLCGTHHEDKLIWRKTPDSYFSVKKGYWVVEECKIMALK